MMSYVVEVLLHLLCAVAVDLSLGLSDTGVVDENVKVTFLFFDGLDELVDAFLVGYVADKRDDLALDVFAVVLYHSLELLLGTSGDVNLYSVDSESLGALNID